MLRLWICLFCCLFGQMLHAQKFVNYPFPQQPDTLRILGIGNSFTDDGMMYLPDLLEAAGIRNVVLGRLYIGGCSLERHCTEYERDAPAYIYYKSEHNRWETRSEQATLKQGIADEPWDIVVLQQASGLSGDYRSFQPWLDRLAGIVRWNCSNAGVCIAWQQTWAYASDSDHGDFVRYGRSRQQMYDSIVAAVGQLLEQTAIEVVIPSGTTIRNLRGTEFCDARELTRDGYHLGLGMGRYAAACAWFQALVAPVLRCSIAGNECRLQGSPHELTPSQAAACQTAARRACILPLAPWTGTE